MEARAAAGSRSADRPSDRASSMPRTKAVRTWSVLPWVNIDETASDRLELQFLASCRSRTHRAPTSRVPPSDSTRSAATTRERMLRSDCRQIRASARSPLAEKLQSSAARTLAKWSAQAGKPLPARVVAFDAREEVGEIRGMPPCDPIALAAFGLLVRDIGAGRSRAADIACAGCCHRSTDTSDFAARLASRLDDIRLADVVGRGDREARFQGERTGEHREPSQDRRLGRRQQVVAPGQGRHSGSGAAAPPCACLATTGRTGRSAAWRYPGCRMRRPGRPPAPARERCHRASAQISATTGASASVSSNCRRLMPRRARRRVARPGTRGRPRP